MAPITTSSFAVEVLESFFFFHSEWQSNAHQTTDRCCGSFYFDRSPVPTSTGQCIPPSGPTPIFFAAVGGVDLRHPVQESTLKRLTVILHL